MPRHALGECALGRTTWVAPLRLADTLTHHAPQAFKFQRQGSNPHQSPPAVRSDAPGYVREGGNVLPPAGYPTAGMGITGADVLSSGSGSGSSSPPRLPVHNSSPTVLLNPASSGSLSRNDSDDSEGEETAVLSGRRTGPVGGVSYAAAATSEPGSSLPLARRRGGGGGEGALAEMCCGESGAERCLCGGILFFGVVLLLIVGYGIWS